MQKIVTFIKYNNLTAIIFSVIFGGVGVTMAASPSVTNSIYASSETVTSIDNSVILATNFDTFNFDLRINSVTEDAHNYYATYSYRTINIEEGAWGNTSVTKVFQMAKVALDGKDFGLYVGKQLSDNMRAELEYLKKVQSIERGKGISQKVVTTQYSGLVGRMIDPNSKVVSGYVPVIPEIIPDPNQSLASVVAAVDSQSQPASNSNVRNLEPGPSLVINEVEIKRIVDQYLSAREPVVADPSVPTDPEPSPEEETSTKPSGENSTPTPSVDLIPTPENPTSSTTPQLPEITPELPVAPAPEPATQAPAVEVPPPAPVDPVPTTPATEPAVQ